DRCSPARPCRGHSSRAQPNECSAPAPGIPPATSSLRREGTMLGINIQQGLTDAWTRIASFVPKFLGFLVILVVGYFIAKLIQRLVDALPRRVGFARGGERRARPDALRR